MKGASRASKARGNARRACNAVGARGLVHTPGTLAPGCTWAALEPLRVEERSCPWRFSSLTEMESFTRQLFGLRGEPPGLLLEALRERVGWREYVDGVELSWRLSAVDLRRLPAS